MTHNFDFIFDKLPCSAFIARPELSQTNPYNSNFPEFPNYVDFEFVALNQMMKDYFSEFICEGAKWSEVKTHLDFDIPWQGLAANVKCGMQYKNIEFYAGSIKKYFKILLQMPDTETFIVVLSDITSEKNYLNKIKPSLTKDPFTGLINRSGFTEIFNEVIENCRHSKKYAGILILDIDNMKSINESQGSSKGDAYILHVAEILKEFQRDFIRIFRYGDDEFLILISDCESYDRVSNYLDAILERFLMENIRISGGISIFPDNTEQKDELIRFADMALRYAKKNGRNNFTYFEPEMQRAFIQRLTLQSKMTDAILECNFNQYYQPQFDVNSGNLRGFEALIRWNDTELGEIPPSVFIPMAEESGLIIPIGRWVLNTAISTLKKWQIKHKFSGIMSVNVSPLQLNQDSFIAELSSLINKYEISPENLEIEITEGVMINDMEMAIDKLNQIKELGIRVSLDDFGTGYSSLSYLQALPLNTLKIDKSFINNITDCDGVQANITNSIITMVKNMGLETIAEGVENPEQLKILSEFNCNAIQGFLRGKPMPYASCDAFLGGDLDALDKL
jgi:diguanylate cyclase (GGDEF)-like protein